MATKRSEVEKTEDDLITLKRDSKEIEMETSDLEKRIRQW